MSLEFCAIACNRIKQGISLVEDYFVYAAGRFVAVFHEGKTMTLKGHTANVTCVTTARVQDKLFIISGSNDKTVIVWEFVDEWKLKTRLQHSFGVVALGVLKDNDRLFFASSDIGSNILIWDNMELIQTINTKPHCTNALALTKLDSSVLLFTGGTDIKLHVYVQDTEFKRVLQLHGHVDWITSIKIVTSTGGHGFEKGDVMIASSSQDRYIRVWKLSSNLQDVQKDGLEFEEDEMTTKTHIIPTKTRDYSILLDAVLMGHDDWIFSVDWAPVVDGLQPAVLVSASADKSIIIWTPDKHSASWIPTVRVGEVGGSTLGFYGAILSGNKLYSNGYNGAIHIWENENSIWTPIVGISGHQESVQSCQFDPSGNFLLTASLDQTARVFAPWEKNGLWHEIARSQIHGYDLNCVAFIDKYRYICGADEKILRIFDAPRTFALSLASITGKKEDETMLDQRPVGANVPALGLSNKAVFESEAPSASLDSRLNAYTAGELTATTTKVLDAPPFEEHLMQHTLWPEIQKLYGHGYEIVAVGAAKDGKLVASSSKATKEKDAVIRLWSTETWTEVGHCAFHSLTVTTISFSTNGYILSAGRDRGWAIFGLNGNLIKGVPKAHARIIWSACWAEDALCFATGSRDKTVKLWSSTTYECLETIAFEDSVTCVSFRNEFVNNQYWKLIRYVLAVGLEQGNIELIYVDRDFRLVKRVPIDSR
jgi:elongator complex protein 2